MLAAPEFEVVKGDHDEGMANAAGSDEFGDSRDINQAGGEVFAVIEGWGVFEFAVFDEHGVADVVHDCRIGKNLADDFCFGAFVARFFAEFSQAGLEGGRIGGIHHAAGDFEFDGIGTVAVLVDHDELASGGEGDDVHPIDGLDDVKIVLLAGAGGNLKIGADGEDAEVADRFGADFFPGLDRAGGHLESILETALLRGPALPHEGEEVSHGLVVGFPRSFHLPGAFIELLGHFRGLLARTTKRGQSAGELVKVHGRA